jgi:hypothetical protein
MYDFNQEADIALYTIIIIRFITSIDTKTWFGEKIYEHKAEKNIILDTV